MARNQSDLLWPFDGERRGCRGGLAVHTDDGSRHPFRGNTHDRGGRVDVVRAGGKTDRPPGRKKAMHLHCGRGIFCGNRARTLGYIVSELECERKARIPSLCHRHSGSHDDCLCLWRRSWPPGVYQFRLLLRQTGVATPSCHTSVV